MSLDVRSIFDGLVDHALASGLFARVNRFEPKSAPPGGLTAAVFVDSIEPIPAASGMESTTGRIVIVVRIHTNMLGEPADDVDPDVVSAVDVLMSAYSADFELGGRVRNVDLLGMHGSALRAQSGYINISGTMFRVMDIYVPIIVNDLWNQGA